MQIQGRYDFFERMSQRIGRTVSRYVKGTRTPSSGRSPPWTGSSWIFLIPRWTTSEPRSGPSGLGTVHVYGILEAAEEGEARDRIQSAARTAGFRMKGLSQHHVRAYSPTKYQTAFDVTVVRG